MERLQENLDGSDTTCRDVPFNNPKTWLLTKSTVIPEKMCFPKLPTTTQPLPTGVPDTVTPNGTAAGSHSHHCTILGEAGREAELSEHEECCQARRVSADSQNP